MLLDLDMLLIRYVDEFQDSRPAHFFFVYIFCVQAKTTGFRLEIWIIEYVVYQHFILTQRLRIQYLESESGG